MTNLSEVWAAGAIALSLATRAWSGVNTYDVRAYGAKGDGSTNDAPAINRAIDAASRAGGGTVELGAGTYEAGSIHLRSHIDFHLGPGAVLEATSDGRAYDGPEANAWGDRLHYQDSGHSHFHDSLIWGEGLDHVSITGPGRIYGKGLSRGHAEDHPGQLIGNKAVALKNCRNVLLRDFFLQHGGWFGLLATGVDNLTIENLTIDTNRDGMDIDCCHNVRIAHCSVNSPWDDGICLKSSFGLGQFRSTENVTIADCLVCGYDEGSLLDGQHLHDAVGNPAPTGRIKFGTESNGGFKSVTITNCVFECSRGLALESVDGALIDNITVSNLAMRHIYGAPLFLRLGARMRGPEHTPVGRLQRVIISNVTAEEVTGDQAILVLGLPEHPIEDIGLHHIQIEFAGAGTLAQGRRQVPEMERDYPEPGSFGVTPAWALFVRHAANVQLDHVTLSVRAPDLRPPIALLDVHGIDLDHVNAAACRGAPSPIIEATDSFTAEMSPGFAAPLENGRKKAGGL